jgi:hypothetical protein
VRSGHIQKELGVRALPPPLAQVLVSKHREQRNGLCGEHLREELVPTARAFPVAVVSCVDDHICAEASTQSRISGCETLSETLPTD